MALHPVMRHLSLFFSFSGFIQSIAWFILSLLSILQYADALHIYTNPKTHNEWFLYFLQTLYFSEDVKNITVTRYVFFGFTIFYFVFSIIWFTISIALFALTILKKWEPLRFFIFINFLIVGIQCVVDIVLMALLANDYNYVLKLYNQSLAKSANETNVLVYGVLAVGFMMTLAARGFLLWIINFAAVIYDICFLAQYQDVAKSVLYNIPIDAYQEYPGDRNFAEAVHSELTQNWHNSGYVNEAYANNPYDNHEQSTNFNHDIDETSNHPVQQNYRDNLNYILRQRPNDAVQHNSNNLYARPNKPTKPIKVGPPVPPKPNKKGPPIPFPDYTPPQSPTHLRPVIKQNSSYY